jgi:predicted TIM-barrel fold metal-dependent hydrolase
MIEINRIIDGHCHVASVDFTPRSFIEGVIENVLGSLAAQGLRPDRNKILKLYLDKMQDPDCHELVAEMAEAGIEKAVLLLPDFTYALRDSTLTISEMFDRHRSLLQRHPDRFIVFGGVDPRWGADGIQLFEKAVTDYGFRGLKLYPPCGYSPSDRGLYPYYEICAQHGLPVLTHTGATSPALAYEPARPILIDQAALDFPTVNFILAHGSIAYVEECIMLCAFRPNMYLDISGFEMSPVESLNPLLSRGINHKIIFGTDWPVFRMQGSQKSFVEKLLDDSSPLGNLRSYEIEAIFRKTMERLLKSDIQIQ